MSRWLACFTGARQQQPRRLVCPEPLEARALLAAASLSPAADGTAQIHQIHWHGRAVEARIDHWIGRLGPAAPGRSVAAGQAVLGGSLTVTHPGWHATALGGGFFSLVTPAATTQAVLRWAAHALAVARLEPDLAIQAASLPNDPLFATQWNLRNTGQYGGMIGTDIRGPQSWEVTAGSRGVVVAVVDSGIEVTHPDLAANIWTNPGEIAGNGIDDDHNGYVDDIHGWNFVDNTNDVSDGYGHGTHVAGIIGAAGDNGLGIVGVCPQVSLMALKFEDRRGVGSTSTMLAALNYATMMRRNHGIDIVATNNSWETTAGPSVVVENAIRAQGAAGIVFVAAAGNNATDSDTVPHYPGSYRLPNVITVAAIDTSGRLATMSNYGATTVDLAAPGTLVQSTFPGGVYGILSGTSMAAPQVTGVVALLAAARPGISVAAVRAAILGSTTPLTGLAGKTATGGRLDARAALDSLGVSAARTVAPQVAVADVHVRARVAVRAVAGQAVGLTARSSGPGESNLYLGQIGRLPTGWFGQIWRNLDGHWKLLGMRQVARGTGLLQFDVVGNRLTLSFNGRALLDVRDNALTLPGSVGSRISGFGNRLDDFMAS